MVDGWWVRPALSYALTGKLAIAAPMLTLAVLMRGREKQVVSLGVYALLLGTTNVALVESVSASTIKKVPGDKKSRPLKEAVIVGATYLSGTAVPLLAGISSACQLTAIGGLIVVMMLPLGYFTAKVTGRNAAARVLRPTIFGLASLAIGYVVLWDFPRIIRAEV